MKHHVTNIKHHDINLINHVSNIINHDNVKTTKITEVRKFSKNHDNNMVNHDSDIVNHGDNIMNRDTNMINRVNTKTNHANKFLKHDNKNYKYTNAFRNHVNMFLEHAYTFSNHTHIFKNLVPYIPALGMLAISALVTMNLTTLPSSANTTADASVIVTASCSFLGITDEAHTATIINGQYKEDIGTTTLRTYCNDANGYEIYAVGYSGCIAEDEATCLTDNNHTKLIEQLEAGSTDTPYLISTGLYPGRPSLANDTPSSWSMKLSAISGTGLKTPDIISTYKDTYGIVPSTSTLVASYPAGTSGDYKTDSSLTTTYDTYINQTQPAGTYQGKVKYTMIQTGANLYPYIQNLASSLCTTESPTIVMDIRDGELYKVQRLADGNCWMLDNLRLDTSTVTMTTDDTNMKAGTSPTATNGTIDSHTIAQINANYKNDVTTNYGLGSGKVGVYYNYCAASAGTYCMNYDKGSGNASYDVCPADWHMPTGGDSGEYQALYTAYNSNVTNFRNALSTPFSGHFINSSQNDLGSVGFFWSSTYCGTDSMYYLSLNSSTVYPQYGNLRYFGFSVRCVLK